MRTTSAIVFLSLALAACACSKQDAAPDKETNPDRTAPVIAQSPAAGPGAPGPGNAPEKTPGNPPDNALVRERAMGLVIDWVAAQNAGDFAAYIALYHPDRFTGVKRVHTGKARKMDLAAWTADRRRMFAKPMTVAAEDVTLNTWLDPGAELPQGVTALRFVQRWKNDRYADHGAKVLRLLWAGDSHRIVYEDMLDSQRGWEPEPDPATRAHDELMRQLADPYSDHAPIIAGLDRDMLIKVARTGGCQVAMLAANRLADMGDDSWLPRRPDKDVPERMARVLCMLPYHDDSDLALQVFRTFLPPDGAAEISAEECLGEGEEPEVIPPVTRASATGDEIDERFGGFEEPGCWPDGMPGVWSCEGIGSGEGIQILLAPASDGRLYLYSIRYTQLTGCGC